MHKYKCATCHKEFDTETMVVKCPFCRSKVLIHVAGEMKKSPKCSSCSGNCTCCSACD